MKVFIDILSNFEEFQVETGSFRMACMSRSDAISVNISVILIFQCYSDEQSSNIVEKQEGKMEGFKIFKFN